MLVSTGVTASTGGRLSWPGPSSGAGGESKAVRSPGCGSSDSEGGVLGVAHPPAPCQPPLVPKWPTADHSSQQTRGSPASSSSSCREVGGAGYWLRQAGADAHDSQRAHMRREGYAGLRRATQDCAESCWTMQ